MRTSGTSHIASGKSGLLSSGEGQLGIPFKSLQGNRPHFKLRRETQDSSPVVTGISGFLSNLNTEVRNLVVFLELRLEDLDSS